MTNQDCEICLILQSNNDDIVIIKTDYWRVVLQRNQAYLGQSFVTLLDHKSSLSELTSNEWNDYEVLVSKLENGIRDAFGAKHFNWACLMNEAHRESPATPHAHWHVFPRYNHTVTVNNVTFKDIEFGHHYQPREFSVNRQTLEQIAAELQKRLA